MATATAVPGVLSVNEAACVTDVPLRQVHRIIDPVFWAAPCYAVRAPASCIVKAQ